MIIIEVLGEKQNAEIIWIYSARHFFFAYHQIILVFRVIESNTGWKTHSLSPYGPEERSFVWQREHFEIFFALSLSLRFCHLKLLWTSPELINWHHNNKEDCYTEGKITDKLEKTLLVEVQSRRNWCALWSGIQIFWHQTEKQQDRLKKVNSAI